MTTTDTNVCVLRYSKGKLSNPIKIIVETSKIDTLFINDF